MAWKDQLQPASFRGVAFFVDRASSEIGRRVVQHEYPGDDRTETEDLGARTPRFLVDAYVLGAGYFAARDALEAALRVPGPGDLVHPYRGNLRVQAVSARIEESTREGGLARFQIEFLRADDVVRPLATADTATDIQLRATVASFLANARLATVFSAPTDTLLEIAQRNIQDVVDRIDREIGRAQTLADEILGFALLPSLLSARLQADIRRITSLVSLRRLFGIGLQSRSQSLQAQINAEAIAGRVQVEAVIVATELAGRLTFPSYDDAIAIRDELAQQLDRLSETADDLLFAALTDLRTALVTHIGATAGDLARITRYTPQETLPALVIAHALYGPAGVADRADELVQRNRIRHPGFVAGGVALEVLTS